MKRDAWFTPAFIKGLVLFVAGLLVLTVPKIAMAGNLHYIAAVALVLLGLSDLWGMSRIKESVRDRRRRLGIISSLIVGVALFLWPGTSLKQMAILLIAYSLFRSGLAFWRALAARRQGKVAPFMLTRAWLNLAFAGLFFILPTTMLYLAIVTLSIFAMIGGLVMAIFALLPRGPDEDNALNRAQFIDIFWNWLKIRDIGKERRKAVARDLYFEAPDRLHKIISYIVLLVLSVSIGTLAIL